MVALLSCSSGTPAVFSSFPPYLFIRSTYSFVTELAPCKTIGNPGIFFSTSSNISNLRGGTPAPGFNLNYMRRVKYLWRSQGYQRLSFLQNLPLLQDGCNG